MLSGLRMMIQATAKKTRKLRAATITQKRLIVNPPAASAAAAGTAARTASLRAA